MLGHEAVARLGADRYAIYPLIGCGACERCAAGEENLCARWRLIGMHRQGVFAESVAVPRTALFPVPDGMASERAVLAEPLACAVGAVRPERLAARTSIVVVGCGPSGYSACLSRPWRAPRSRRSTDSPRGASSRSLGASQVARRPRARAAGGGAGRRRGRFEATWRASLELVRSGGEVVVLGLGEAEGSFPMATLVRRGISMRGQFAYSRGDFSAALAILAEETLDLDWLSLEPLATAPPPSHCSSSSPSAT